LLLGEAGAGRKGQKDEQKCVANFCRANHDGFVSKD
jgi:hypothetical protein